MEKTYSQLSIEERTMIQTQLGMGVKAAAIAAGLMRSTITRELRRNGCASVMPNAARRRSWQQQSREAFGSKRTAH